MARSFDQKTFLKGKAPFTIVPMEITTDEQLSVYAFRILVYGLGKPDDFTHTIDRLARAVRMDIKTVRKAVNELVGYGYAIRRQWRDGQANRADITFMYPPIPPGTTAVVDHSDPGSGTGCDVPGEKIILTRDLAPGGEAPGAASRVPNEVVGTSSEVGDLPSLVYTEKDLIKDLSCAAPPRTTAVADPGIVGTPSPTNGSRHPTMIQFQVVDDDPDDLDEQPSVPAKPRKVPKPRNTTGDDQFEQFWTIYERRGTKKQAVAQWKKSITRATPEEIIDGARRYVASTPDARYRKHAERWLRDDCWQDEVLSLSPSSTNGHVAYRNPTDSNAYRNGMLTPNGKLKIST